MKWKWKNAFVWKVIKKQDKSHLFWNSFNMYKHFIPIIPDLFHLSGMLTTPTKININFFDWHECDVVALCFCISHSKRDRWTELSMEIMEFGMKKTTRNNRDSVIFWYVCSVRYAHSHGIKIYVSCFFTQLQKGKILSNELHTLII